MTRTKGRWFKRIIQVLGQALKAGCSEVKTGIKIGGKKLRERTTYEAGACPTVRGKRHRAER
jgi:hypothetical protein